LKPYNRSCSCSLYPCSERCCNGQYVDVLFPVRGLQERQRNPGKLRVAIEFDVGVGNTLDGETGRWSEQVNRGGPAGIGQKAMTRLGCSCMQQNDLWIVLSPFGNPPTSCRGKLCLRERESLYCKCRQCIVDTLQPPLADWQGRPRIIFRFC